MIIYNALPTVYPSLETVIQQIPQLHDMGVDILWLNPIQYSRRHPKYRGGSLYSMNDDRQFFSQWHNGDIDINQAELKALNQVVCAHGMYTMFDLVMNQVGSRLPLIAEHPDWFSDRSRGAFDFSTEEKCCQIFEGYFKEYITHYVMDFGFRAMRIDGAAMVPAIMQKMAIEHFRALTAVLYGHEGIVLGEYLGSNEDLSRLIDQDVKYDLITNSTYWNVNTGPFLSDEQRGAHNEDMGKRRQLSHLGTIGWTGNHDMRNLAQTCYHHYRSATGKSPSAFILEKMMRERIAVMAMVSDGGYYILCGDEYGVMQRRSCFEWEGEGLEPALRAGQTFEEHWGGQYDFHPYIKDLNQIIKRLPKADKLFWSELYLLPESLDKFRNIRCVVRYNGEGAMAPMDIIIMNVHPTHPFEFGNHHLSSILEQIVSKHEVDLAEHPSIRVHLNDSIQLTEPLNQLVTLAGNAPEARLRFK